jgi:hypothetical protein
MTEIRGQKSEDRGRRTEIRGQESEDRDRMTEVSTAAGLKSGQFNHQETVPFWCRFVRGFEFPLLRSSLLTPDT